MLRLMRLLGIFVFTVILIGPMFANAEEQVSIEFLYIDPSQIQSGHQCWRCPGWLDAWDKFITASNIVDSIQKEYGDKVAIERIDRRTSEGQELFAYYNCTGPQVVVLNHKLVLQGDQLTEKNVVNYVDMYLRGEDPSSINTQPMSALLAFSLGLFSGVSPCLMAMLAFILSYSSGTASNFKSGMLRVLVFGLGFLSAIMLLGTMVSTVLTSVPSLYNAVMWIISVLMILIGLHLVGLFNVPFSTKPLVQKLAQKHSATALGLFSLGFIFYFVNLCTAPLSFTVLPTLTGPGNLHLLALFGLGVLIPFLAVGVLAGGSPALAKRIREQQRRKIRVISGLILLAYALWLIVFHLL